MTLLPQFVVRVAYDPVRRVYQGIDAHERVVVTATDGEVGAISDSEEMLSLLNSKALLPPGEK